MAPLGVAMYEEPLSWESSNFDYVWETIILPLGVKEKTIIFSSLVNYKSLDVNHVTSAVCITDAGWHIESRKFLDINDFDFVVGDIENVFKMAEIRVDGVKIDGLTKKRLDTECFVSSFALSFSTDEGGIFSNLAQEVHISTLPE